MAQKSTPLGLATCVGYGQRFQQLGDASVYLLCQVDKNTVQLICQHTGNRWDDHRVLVGDATKLTREEIIRVFDSNQYNWARLEGK